MKWVRSEKNLAVQTFAKERLSIVNFRNVPVEHRQSHFHTNAPGSSHSLFNCSTHSVPLTFFSPLCRFYLVFVCNLMELNVSSGYFGINREKIMIYDFPVVFPGRVMHKARRHRPSRADDCLDAIMSCFTRFPCLHNETVVGVDLPASSHDA
jgi:hypothetical protein